MEPPRIIREWPDSKRRRHIGNAIELRAEDYTGHCMHRKWHWERGWERVCCRCYGERYWKSKEHVEGEVIHEAWEAEAPEGAKPGDFTVDSKRVLDHFWESGGPSR